MTTTYDETQAIDQAAKLATLWEDSAASIAKRAQSARKLMSIEGMTQAQAVILLKRAIAAARVAVLPEAAKEVASVDAVAETIKLSTSAISQYVTALERAELICETHEGGTLDNILVRELYRAAVSHVKAGDIKRIIEQALQCETIKSRIELAIEYLVTAVSDAGITKAEQRAKRERVKADENEASGGEAKHSFTLAELHEAVKAVSKQAETPKGAELVLQIGAMIQRELS